MFCALQRKLGFAVFPPENRHSHVVLDELLYFAVGVFVLAVFDGAFFKLVVEFQRAEQDDSPGRQKKRGNVNSSDRVMDVYKGSYDGRSQKGRKSYLLSLDAVALEERLGVGVGEAVVVPQGAGRLHELHLCGALVIAEEPWDPEKNRVQLRVQ